MAANMLPQTDSSISNPGTTVIHIHGDVTVKLDRLTINIGTLCTTTANGVHRDQDQEEDTEAMATAPDEKAPDQSQEVPELQAACEDNQENGDEAEDDGLALLQNILAKTKHTWLKDLHEARQVPENLNERGLYSACREAGCDARLGNMFEREEHEVTKHFLCGDCLRKFACLEDTQQVCITSRLHSVSSKIS
jgi:hypothetical protein